MFNSDSEYLNTDFKWPENIRLHEDNTFGHLTLDAGENNHFTLKYEGFEAALAPQQGICIKSSGTIPMKYFLERIALPFLRLLNGFILLHASALSTPYGGIAFLAPSGVGKSTFASVLLDFTDIKLMTDDIATISNGFLYPLSSQLAMRHNMADCADYVKDIEFNGYKRLLNIHPNKIEHDPVPLACICLLESGTPTPPQFLSFSDSLPQILSQHLKLSNPPSDFVRAQFHAALKLKSIPCLKLAISCQNKKDILQSAHSMMNALQSIH